MPSNRLKNQAQNRETNTSEREMLRKALSSPSLGNKVVEEAREELNVEERFIDFPPILTVQTDEKGRAFIEDLNSVVRYYLGTNGSPVVTEDYREKQRVVSHNQHSDTTLDGLILE